MSRVPQPEGSRGSLRWIQRAVEERWLTLEGPIISQLGADRVIEWKSPLRSDQYAEYRDGEFLDELGLSALRAELGAFWPSRGPQWDALGVTDRGEVLLVEAKAHVGEMCSPGTMAGEDSRRRIEARLHSCAERLGARPGRAEWTEHFYQLANRLAHLHFLRDHGVPAFLVLVNFLGDADMHGPSSREVWEAAYAVAFSVMGLSRRGPAFRHVIEVYPDVSGLFAE